MVPLFVLKRIAATDSSPVLLIRMALIQTLEGRELILPGVRDIGNR
jgi:hypothetical protein